MENDIFWSEIGSGFGELGGTPPPKITRSTPFRVQGQGVNHVGWFISVIIHEDKVYPWTRWYTRRSFAPGAFPWSMLQKQNPSCVSVLISTCVALWQRTRWCNVLVLIAVSSYILANSLATTSLGTKFRILQNLGKKRGVNDCHHRWKFWWSRSVVTPTIRTKNTLSTALLYF